MDVPPLLGLTHALDRIRLRDIRRQLRPRSAIGNQRRIQGLDVRNRPQGLGQLFGRHTDLLGHVGERRVLPRPGAIGVVAEPLLEFGPHLRRLAVQIQLVDRHLDRARLLGQCAPDGLPDPPGGVGRELQVPLRLELPDGLHQPDVAFLDQVTQRKPLPPGLLGDRDHQAQVALDHLLAVVVEGLQVFCRGLLGVLDLCRGLAHRAAVALFVRLGQESVAVRVPQVQPHGVEVPGLVGVRGEAQFHRNRLGVVCRFRLRILFGAVLFVIAKGMREKGEVFVIRLGVHGFPPGCRLPVSRWMESCLGTGQEMSTAAGPSPPAVRDQCSTLGEQKTFPRSG